MVLIADCGGTKCDWRLITPGTIEQFQTDGFSPFSQEFNDLYAILDNQLKPNLAFDSVLEVYFYGTGMAFESMKNQTIHILKQYFTNATIQVDSDLLAAAHALCGHAPGIACILGTGSNSCFYDGNQIVKRVPPLGFILGDEGSGAAFGKQLLKDYCRGTMPVAIKDSLERRFSLSIDMVVEKVYRTEKPNHYLAGFARFLLQNIKEPYISRLVYDQISVFFDQVLSLYPELKSTKVHFVGSVAFYFSNYVRKVGQDKGVSIGVIMETPIAGLTLHHQKSLNS
jgi:glucosamine kinase